MKLHSSNNDQSFVDMVTAQGHSPTAKDASWRDMVAAERSTTVQQIEAMRLANKTHVERAQQAAAGQGWKLAA